MTVRIPKSVCDLNFGGYILLVMVFWTVQVTHCYCCGTINYNINLSQASISQLIVSAHRISWLQLTVQELGEAWICLGRNCLSKYDLHKVGSRAIKITLQLPQRPGKYNLRVWSISNECCTHWFASPSCSFQAWKCIFAGWLKVPLWLQYDKQWLYACK